MVGLAKQEVVRSTRRPEVLDEESLAAEEGVVVLPPTYHGHPPL